MSLTAPAERRHAWEWQATGTRWRIFHSGSVSGELAVVVAMAVERDEARWSRFRPDSELSLVNREAGSPLHVTEETFELLSACRRFHEDTGGLFQPLVGRALEAWGYERSLAERPAGTAKSPLPEPLTASFELDTVAGAVRIPEGTALDLGGVAKSWIAVRAGELLAARSSDPSLLIDAGGDLVSLRGSQLVAVEAPGSTETAGVYVRLEPGQGIATSGTGRRRWKNGDGADAHHLIDPRTGAPGAQATATAVADDPVAADVEAKVLALRPERLEQTTAAARVATTSGVLVNRRWGQLSVFSPSA